MRYLDRKVIVMFLVIKEQDEDDDEWVIWNSPTTCLSLLP